MHVTAAAGTNRVWLVPQAGMVVCAAGSLFHYPGGDTVVTPGRPCQQTGMRSGYTGKAAASGPSP